MWKIFYLILTSVSFLGLSGCYQAHSSDDLRSVPVTNNPNIVPSSDGMNRFIAMPH